MQVGSSVPAKLLSFSSLSAVFYQVIVHFSILPLALSLQLSSFLFQPYLLFIRILQDRLHDAFLFPPRSSFNIQRICNFFIDSRILAIDFSLQGPLSLHLAGKGLFVVLLHLVVMSLLCEKDQTVSLACWSILVEKTHKLRQQIFIYVFSGVNQSNDSNDESFVQYYQLKEQMQAIDCYLQQHFAELDKITYKALALAAESSFDEEFNAPPLKVQKYHEERYNDENEEDDSLQELSAIPIDQELINALNRVFDERYMGNPKEALFARQFHMQRKCIKAIEKKKEKLEDDDLKYEEKCFQISLGEELNLFFTSDDLKSITKGPIAYCIIQNFVNILQAAKVITENIYVFPQQFLQQLMGGDHFNDSKEGLEALKGIISKNFETYHSEININLLEPDYLIIPIFLGECQKCMIVQLCNKTGKNNPKFNVILCNLSEEKGKMYVLAIRTILEMAVVKAKINKNVNFSTIPIIVPRQPNQEDSSLYLLLCLEFLFAKKCAELHDLKSYSSRMKLHLFPRCISLKSREEIYNLFIELAEEQSLLKRVLLCQEFICNRMKIRNEAPMKFNYDDIDQREVKKYLILKRKAISKANTVSAFQDNMEYYLDDEINYQQSFQ